MEAAAHPWPTLGVLILRDGLVSKEQLEAILDDQRDSRQQRMSGHRLGEVLIERGLVTATQVAKLIAEQYELPFSELDTADIDLRVARRFTEELARRLSAVPISALPDGSCTLAIADPATVLFSDELRRVLGTVPHFVVVGPDAMESALAFVFDRPVEPFDEQLGMPDAEGTVHELRPAAAYTDPDVAGVGLRPTPVEHHNPPLGALLVREGLISEEDLDTALAQQRLSTSWRLGEILVNRGLVTPAEVARLIAEQYELQYVDLPSTYVDPLAATRLPREMAREFPALPIAIGTDGSLQVAIADPTNVYYSDELHRALGVPLTFVVAAPDAIDEVLVSLPEPSEPQPEPEPVALAFVEEETDPPVSPLRLSDQLSSAVAPEESVTEAEDGLPDFVEDGVVRLEPPAHEDDAVVDGLPEWVEDEVAVGEVVPSQEVEEPESVADEPVLGWLPTWTTEISLTDAESETGDAEATDADADDLSAALLAEAVQSDEPGLSKEDDENVEQVASVLPDELEDEVTHAEPAPVMTLVEPARADDDQDDEFQASRPPYELDEAPPAESTPDLDDLDTAVEHVLALGASSVHFSPRGDEYVVRARVDGVVRELGFVANEDLESIVERFECSAAMRVEVVPTAKGDKVTLFPLDRPATPTGLEELGLTGEAGEAVHAALARPSGVVIVCGPVESGTSSTLYALLETLATPDRIVATIEDPIVRVLEGVDQTAVDVASGVTFAEGLRRLLASDSDAVLVGEISDHETAELAFSGALAGRHVLAGLRAPSAASAIRRLLDLGLEPNILGEALTCVVAQRLVRRICEGCRETHYASEAELAELGQPVEDNGPRLLARGRGCVSCDGTGFRGRVGIVEVLSMTAEVRALVTDGASMNELQRAALAGGMRTLREDAIRLCLEGVTTSSELTRVLGAEL